MKQLKEIISFKINNYYESLKNIASLYVQCSLKPSDSARQRTVFSFLSSHIRQVILAIQNLLTSSKNLKIIISEFDIGGICLSPDLFRIFIILFINFLCGNKGIYMLIFITVVGVGIEFYLRKYFYCSAMIFILYYWQQSVKQKF